MMKFLFLFISILCGLKALAQDYLISFTGTGGSTTVNTVKVENLSAGTILTLNGNDVLRLTGAVGITQMENRQSSEIKIYPNPMTDNSILQIYPSYAGDAIITVFDMTGKKVAQINSFLEKDLHEFHLSGIKSGLYLVSVKGANYHLSGKLLCNGKAGGRISIKKINRNTTDEKNPVQLDYKGDMATINMTYTNGDRLKFTGKSGIYSTVITDIPVSDKTITFNFIACTDADGNNYPVVEISSGKGSSLIAIAENLKTAKYSDGSNIPLVFDDKEWGNLWTGAFCYYDNSPDKGAVYGKLYNWYAVNDSRNICPTGWHVATYGDWLDMGELIGEWVFWNGIPVIADAGCKLKETGIGHWNATNVGATNQTGFTALPGGCRESTGSYTFMGRLGTWWTSTSYGILGEAHRWTLSSDDCLLFKNTSGNRMGFSVRCFKDESKP